MLYRVIFFLFLFSFDITISSEVNLYTTRHYEADYEIYKKFEQKTGIKVNVVSGKSKPLEKRIIEEGMIALQIYFFWLMLEDFIQLKKKEFFRK